MGNKKSKFAALFQEYPDVVSVPQLCKMLGVCKGNAYQLLHSGQIKYLRVGQVYRSRNFVSLILSLQNPVWDWWMQNPFLNLSQASTQNCGKPYLNTTGGSTKAVKRASTVFVT